MTLVVGLDEREQTTAKTEADSYGMTNKRTTATAGPSTPLLARARATPLRMTHHWGGWKRTGNGKDRSRSLRDDKQKDNGKSNGRSNSKDNGRSIVFMGKKRWTR